MSSPLHGPAGLKGRGDSTRDRGRHVETRAAAFLRARGIEILATNVTMAGAEIDLVGRCDDHEPTIVFVEVRSRADAERGAPIETIGPEKQRRIVRAATAWLVANELWERVAVRFDIVTVTGEIDDAPIDWVVGAFEANG